MKRISEKDDRMLKSRAGRKAMRKHHEGRHQLGGHAVTVRITIPLTHHWERHGHDSRHLPGRRTNHDLQQVAIHYHIPRRIPRCRECFLRCSGGRILHHRGRCPGDCQCLHRSRFVPRNPYAERLKQHREDAAPGSRLWLIRRTSRSLFNIWGVFRVDRGIATVEVVVELLDAVHAWLSDCALGDLANGREGHPGLSSNPLLRDLLFRKSRHHEFVDIYLASHG